MCRYCCGSQVTRLRRVPKIFLVSILVLIVQEALFPQIRLFGSFPDIFPALVVCVAIYSGPEHGAITGFLIGLAADIFLTSPFGVSALVYTLVGYLIGRMAESIDWKNSWTAVAIICSVGTAISGVGFGTILLLLGNDAIAKSGFISSILLTSAFNLFLGPLVGGLLNRPSRKQSNIVRSGQMVLNQ